MVSGAGSPLSHHSFSSDLHEERSANPIEVLSLNCSNVQIIQLAKIFRQWPDRQILSWVDEHRCHSSTTSNSDRNSLFSVLSGTSQATTLSNQSHARYTPTERLNSGNYFQPPDHTHRQASPILELIEPINQYPVLPVKQNPPVVYICVACNILCTNKSSLSRHYQQHCERDVVWLCRLCAPRRNFYRKDKLSQHHIDRHGKACVEGCREHGKGLCGWHLEGSIFNLPKKRAWGCPCCLRWFDSRETWTKHGANHAVENDKVVGWSLSTMVQSLLFQPFLTEAIARSPLQIGDTTKAKADVCQNLREALERHRLPDGVQAHYDYRHLQLPEALALYAFRLVTYGEPFLDDISVIPTATGPPENAANDLHKRQEGELFAPIVTSISIPPASGYWNPEDPFTYSSQAGRLVEPQSVRGPLTGDVLAAASRGDHGIRSSGLHTGNPSSAVSLQFYDENLLAMSAASSSEQILPVQLYGNPGRIFQESSVGERGRGRALSVKKSLQNLVHRPSYPKSSNSRMDTIPPVPTIPDPRASEHASNAPALDYNRELARAEPMETVSTSPAQARFSGRMSGIQWEEWLTQQPDEQHDS